MFGRIVSPRVEGVGLAGVSAHDEDAPTAVQWCKNVLYVPMLRCVFVWFIIDVLGIPESEQ